MLTTIEKNRNDCSASFSHQSNSAKKSKVDSSCLRKNPTYSEKSKQNWSPGQQKYRENSNIIQSDSSISSISLQENTQKERDVLKDRVYQLQIKQRQYIRRIVELETMIARQNLQKSGHLTKNKQRTSIQVPQEHMKLLGLHGHVKQNSKTDKNQNLTSDQQKLNLEQKKFCEAFRKNYMSIFGLNSLKDIWKKNKQILTEWILSENK